MDNPAFKDDENIPLMHDDDDDDDIRYTHTGEEGETSFSTLSEETPGSKIIPLSNELKKQKIQALYDFWGVGGNVNFAELDRFRLNRNETTGNTELKFKVGDDWVSLSNSRNGKCFAQSTVIGRMKGGGGGGGGYAMKNIFRLDETPLQSERSKKAARKLAKSMPTDLEMDNISMQELSRVVINVKNEVRETSQNTDLDMLEVIEPLQRIQREFDNIAGKLTGINEHIEREQQKLDIIANDATYTDEQRQEVQSRMDTLKEEHSNQLELLSQN